MSSYQNRVNYYTQLTQSGMPAAQAYQQATQKYPFENDQKEAYKSQQSSALGGTAGLVGGAVLTNSLIKNGVGGTIDKVSGWFGGGNPASTASTTPSTVANTLGTASNAGGAIAPTLDAGRYALTNSSSTLAPGAASAGGYTSGAEGAISNLGSDAANGAGYMAPALGALGAGAGAYGLYDTFKNKKHGLGGAAQGALGAGGLTAGLGAMAPLLGLGPVGWAGIALAAALGGGAGYFGNFGDKDEWKNEGKALKKLSDQGYNIDPSLLNELTSMKKGRSMEDLRRMDAEKEARGEYTNAKFRESRNEADLNPQDIQGYSSLYELAGKGGSDADRMELARRALAAGAAREAKGQITLDTTKFDSNLDSFRKSQQGRKKK